MKSFVTCCFLFFEGLSTSGELRLLTPVLVHVRTYLPVHITASDAAHKHKSKQLTCATRSTLFVAIEIYSRFSSREREETNCSWSFCCMIWESSMISYSLLMYESWEKSRKSTSCIVRTSHEVPGIKTKVPPRHRSPLGSFFWTVGCILLPSERVHTAVCFTRLLLRENIYPSCVLWWDTPSTAVVCFVYLRILESEGVWDVNGCT